MQEQQRTALPGGTRTSAEPRLRRIFGLLNRYWWLPILRSGLGPFFVTPFGGYVMVLRTTGRKSGARRDVPLNYAVDGGCVYCVAGFGPGAHWYRNLEADPRVEVILPAAAFAGTAETVTDDVERTRMLRQVLVAGGFAGFGLGTDPRTASEDELRERAAGLPLVRIRPTGIAAGPSDPGGRAWVWAQGLMTIAMLWLIGRVVGRLTRQRRARTD